MLEHQDEVAIIVVDLVLDHQTGIDYVRAYFIELFVIGIKIDWKDTIAFLLTKGAIECNHMLIHLDKAVNMNGMKARLNESVSFVIGSVNGTT